jgi:VanZ family protein
LGWRERTDPVAAGGRRGLMTSGGASRGRLITLWGPVAIYVLLIFYVSSMSNPPGVPPIRHFDKLIHFCEYGLLGALLGRALGLTGLRQGYLAVALASLAIGAFVGMADETYQGTVAGREKSAADFAFDLAGILTSLLLLRAWASRRDRGSGAKPPTGG